MILARHIPVTLRDTDSHINSIEREGLMCDSKRIGRLYSKLKKTGSEKIGTSFHMAPLLLSLLDSTFGFREAKP